MQYVIELADDRLIIPCFLLFLFSVAIWIIPNSRSDQGIFLDGFDTISILPMLNRRKPKKPTKFACDSHYPPSLRGVLMPLNHQ